MGLITSILSFFGNYTPIVSFLGAIVGGEETLILLTILASHGHLNIWYLCIFYYIGIITSDMLWYFLGKSKLFDSLMQKRFLSKVYATWGKMLDTTTEKNIIMALVITKFLYGSRIPTIMYLAREKIKVRPFVEYTLILNLIWMFVIVLIGWFTGKGISLAASISDNIVLYLFLLGIVMVVFTVLTRVVSSILKKWLEKKRGQLK